MFSGGPFGGSDTYGAYERITEEANWDLALNQAQRELLKYHQARLVSQRQIMMNGMYPGLEVEFQKTEDPNTQGKLRIYFVQNFATRSGQPKPRLYAVEAIGSKEFLASPQTKEVLESLKVRVK